MVFHLITIFPEAIKGYFDSSILRRAQERGLIKIKFYNPRDFAKDRYKKVDDKPFGGGPGMVMRIEPLIRAVQSAKSKISAKGGSASGGKNQKSKIIILAPTGKQFTQEMAWKWVKDYKNMILISGHYEGIDERVSKILKAEKISIGPYVLTGGELAAGIIVDAVSRHIPGVLGKKESLEEKRGTLGVPVYTRPEIFEYKGKKYRVPKVLLSGNHAKIEEWRKSRKFDN